MTDVPEQFKSIAASSRGKILSIVMRAIAPVLKEIKADIDELKARPTMDYRGVWKEGAYVKGSVVTWNGCMWYAHQTTGKKPSEPDSGWTMCVKSGRDAR